MKNIFLISIVIAMLGGCSSSNFDQQKSSNLRSGVSTSDTNETSFNNDVLLSKKPVLVDFYATWCGPCKIMAPILDDVATQYSGEIKVMRVDIDRSPTLASRYNIAAVPTIVVFNQGVPSQSLIGVVPQTEISSKINEVLKKNKMIGARTKTTSN